MELTIDEKIELFEEIGNTDDKNILLKQIYNILEKSGGLNGLNTINCDNILKDLNIFGENSVFDKINLTKTLYGEYILREWISSPTRDINFLKNKQKKIKYFCKNKIGEKIDKICKCEGHILWFWNEITEDIQSIYDIVYFNIKIPYFDKTFSKIINTINENEAYLNISSLYNIYFSPILTIFIPLLSFIVPYLLMWYYKMKVNMNDMIKIIMELIKSQYSYGGYISLFISGIYLFLYLQTSYSSIMNSIKMNKIIDILNKKINYVVDLIDAVKYVKSVISVPMSINIDMELKYFEENIINHNFTNKGCILASYHRFLNNKEKLCKILRYIGEIDAYISLSKLITDEKNAICFTRFSIKTQPYISAKDIWHPNIKNPVANSIKLRKNMLITGPNKAGKSVFIKSVALSILLSQTVGIAPAKRFTITPFSVINSYLHRSDSVGYRSLFEEEIIRSKEHIDNLNKLNHSGFAFIVMDEIFTSTNYNEGYKAAETFCKKICTYVNSISIITTHFTDLHKLEGETGKKILNYRFKIDRDSNGGIIFPHILERGYSDQRIAIELLENQNYLNT